jgi:SAM-dependent methyltransferase
MSSLGRGVMAIPGVRAAGRFVADWVDLQWSLLVGQLRDVAPLARGRLLDVGCGEKPYESLFAPFVVEYIGVEHEATFTATEASSRRGKPDVLYDGLRLPFEDETFDTLLSIQVLEHTPKPGDLLAEMARVVKKGGLLILSAPFSFRLHEEPHDYYRYTPHGLRAMCKTAGFEVTEIRPQGGLWSVLAHKVNTFLAFRVGALEGVTQAMGKLGHEDARPTIPRFWVLPLVAPIMGCASAAARVMDRAVPDETEALGYLVLARRAL